MDEKVYSQLQITTSDAWSMKLIPTFLFSIYGYSCSIKFLYYLISFSFI